MVGRFAQPTFMPRRPIDPRVGQFWRDLLYGARGPRPPFQDPAPAPAPDPGSVTIPEPTIPPPSFDPAGPFGPSSRSSLDIQRSLADALRRGPASGPASSSPISDVPVVRIPSIVTCRGNCTLFNAPNAGPIIAQLGPGTPLRRVGAPLRAADGSAWLQVEADITVNFNVRTVRGYIPLSDIQEAGTLAPPPPVNNGPPTQGGEQPVTTEPSMLRTVGEIALLTSPAWGAFLLSRFLR